MLVSASASGPNEKELVECSWLAPPVPDQAPNTPAGGTIKMDDQEERVGLEKTIFPIAYPAPKGPSQQITGIMAEGAIVPPLPQEAKWAWASETEVPPESPAGPPQSHPEMPAPQDNSPQPACHGSSPGCIPAARQVQN